LTYNPTTKDLYSYTYWIRSIITFVRNMTLITLGFKDFFSDLWITCWSFPERCRFSFFLYCFCIFVGPSSSSLALPCPALLF
jgi:hypothetical protein